MTNLLDRGTDMVVIESINDVAASFEITGIPATFATAKEQSWRERLASIVGQPIKDLIAQGYEMDFKLDGPSEGPFAQDPDNLAEPVFAELIGKLGWSDGKRPNVQWFKVSKSYGGTQGMTLNIYPTNRWFSEPIGSKVVFSVLCYKPYPKDARDDAFCDWIASQMAIDVKKTNYHVSISFGGGKANIASIATGVVKHIIDCLYPVIGGKLGAPEDWRIQTLLVEKNVPGIPDGAYAITVREL